MQHSVCTRHFYFSVSVSTADIRNHKTTLYKRMNLTQCLSIHGTIMDFQRHRTYGQFLNMSHSLFSFSLFLCCLYTQQIFQSQQRQNTANHTQRISYGITQGDLRRINSVQITVCLLCRAKSRRIGYSSRKDTDHCSDRCSGNKMQDDCHHNTGKHNNHGNDIQRKASLLECREETGSYLQTD